MWIEHNTPYFVQLPHGEKISILISQREFVVGRDQLSKRETEIERKRNCNKNKIKIKR